MKNTQKLKFICRAIWQLRKKGELTIDPFFTHPWRSPQISKWECRGALALGKPRPFKQLQSIWIRGDRIEARKIIFSPQPENLVFNVWYISDLKNSMFCATLCTKVLLSEPSQEGNWYLSLQNLWKRLGGSSPIRVGKS
jgi:hypothetical protein